MWNTQNPNANFRLELRRNGETSWNTLEPRLIGNTYALQNLETGTAYQIRVAQVCENNLSDYSNTLRFTTQNCEEPKKITLQNVGYTAATLAFTGLTADRYQAYYKSANPIDSGAVKIITGGRYRLEGLLPGTAYQVKVRRLCDTAAGVVSGYFPTLFFTTLHCQAPQGLKLQTVTANTARLAWQNNNPNGVSRMRYRQAGETDWRYLPPAATAELTLANLRHQTRYQAQVAALCPEGGEAEYSESLFFTTAPACAPPQALREENVSATAALLRWEYGVTEGAYELEYSLERPRARWQKVIVNTNEALLTRLLPLQTYKARVRRLCGNGQGGNSEFSKIISFRTAPCLCPPPPNVRIAEQTAHTVAVAWDRVPLPRATYDIRYRLKGAAGWLYAYFLDTNYYRLPHILDPETAYEFQVKLSCPGDAWCVFPITAITAPGFCPPHSFRSLENDTLATALTYEWEAPKSGAERVTGYRLGYRTHNPQAPSGWQDIILPPAARSYQAEGLSPRDEYEFRLQALYPADTASPFVYSFFRRSRPEFYRNEAFCALDSIARTSGVRDTIEGGGCTYTDHYRPNSNTPIRTFRVNVHYMCYSQKEPFNFTKNDNGWGNIPTGNYESIVGGRNSTDLWRNVSDKEALPSNGLDFAKKLIDNLNGGFARADVMKEWVPGAPGPPPALDKKILVALAKDPAGHGGYGVYYHYTDTTDSPGDCFACQKRSVTYFHDKYGIGTDSVFNIFFLFTNTNNSYFNPSEPHKNEPRQGFNGWPAHNVAAGLGINTASWDYSLNANQIREENCVKYQGHVDGIGTERPQLPYLGTLKRSIYIQGEWFLYGRSMDPGAKNWKHTPDTLCRCYNNGGMYLIAPLVKHEMLHLMNLHHTNRADWGGEVSVQNDYCPDTPDMSQGSKAKWNGHGNNVMEYAADRNALTPNQLGRVHFWIEKYGRKYYIEHDTICKAKPGADIVIPRGANAVWENIRTVRGNVIVKSGGRLTIRCTVHFPENAKLIVERGGRLVIDGGTLTANCGGKMWRGVEVWGTASREPEFTSAHGGVELLNNARIERSAIGILAGRIDHSPGRETPNPAFAGGKIEARNATIANNHIGVRFFPYPLANFLSQSEFTQTQFVSDSPLRDSYRYPAQGSYIHLWLEGMPSVALANCAFLKEGDSPPTHSVGIFAQRSRLSANAPNTFRGLAVGIEAEETTLELSAQVFENNIAGVQAFDSPFTVQNCTFTGGKTGIESNRVASANSWLSQKFTVSQNTFIQQTEASARLNGAHYNVTIAQNEVQKGLGTGFWLHGAQNIAIEGNAINQGAPFSTNPAILLENVYDSDAQHPAFAPWGNAVANNRIRGGFVGLLSRNEAQFELFCNEFFPSSGGDPLFIGWLNQGKYYNHNLYPVAGSFEKPRSNFFNCSYSGVAAQPAGGFSLADVALTYYPAASAAPGGNCDYVQPLPVAGPVTVAAPDIDAPKCSFINGACNFLGGKIGGGAGKGNLWALSAAEAAEEARFDSLTLRLSRQGLPPQNAAPQEKAWVRAIAESGGRLSGRACAFLRAYDKSACPNLNSFVLPPGKEPAQAALAAKPAEYEVYPIPASSFLTVRSRGAAQPGARYQILDLAGKTLRQGTLSAEGVAQIDIAALSGGAYLLQITDDALSSFTTKFIKP